jgi:DNA excision repair protein ERCC-2
MGKPQAHNGSQLRSNQPGSTGRGQAPEPDCLHNSIAADIGQPESWSVATAAKPVFSVQVRELVEFSLRRGDLGGERDFVGPRRALAGIRAHTRLRRGRPAEYEWEVPVCHEWEAGDVVLRVQGRIDGLLTTPAETRIEEIKTVQGFWNRTADPLHWAQAKCYGFIYAHQHELERITIQLTYVELDTGELTEFQGHFGYADLSAFFAEATAIYLEWVQESYRWRQRRDQSLRHLLFPFPRYRPGQRRLAVVAYRTLARGGRLFLEAPTGIGKTVSILFAALKTMSEGRLERLYYLTARTVGRTVAQNALANLRGAGMRLRTLTLTAKDKLCFQSGAACDAATCPFALGYYDRRRPAMRAALDCEAINREALEQLARQHQVCPFELSLDVSVWVDALICDYNYLFDPKVWLRRHFADRRGDFAFLVDEAHNLVDRAREVFSADLDARELQAARQALRTSLPRCARALGRVISAMRDMSRRAGAAAEPSAPPPTVEELDLFSPAPPASGTGGLPARDQARGVLTTGDLPRPLLVAVESADQELASWLGRNEPAAFRDELLQLYFRLRAFLRTAEFYDEHYVTIVEPGPPARVRLFCRDPALLLREAQARGKATVFFSATLAPIDYYRALLGGTPDDPLLQLASPFPPENLAVLVHERIRTHLKARPQTLAEVVRAIGALVVERQGNYLVYFPSYEYLRSVQEHFQALHPAIPLLAQRPGMTEAEREAFLAAFAAERRDTLVGFAVLGGLFGEGIDLAGDRLIGAVIVGVGLPQLSVERDLIRDYFEAQNGSGFDYAYTYPGMNRVLQAGGRVIRSETDRGMVLLIDTRFAQDRYRRLFPAWWQVRRVTSAKQIREAASEFWKTPARLG